MNESEAAERADDDQRLSLAPTRFPSVSAASAHGRSRQAAGW
jgi:hypothetical protein